MDYSYFFDIIKKNRLRKLLRTIPDKIYHIQKQFKKNKDYIYYTDQIKKLPNIQSKYFNFNTNAITIGKRNEINEEQEKILNDILLKFHPWRKGPYSLFDIYIDTEWRSDMKWDRIINKISPLKDRYVLDIGCGNGYHCWRMLGQKAKLIIGIDPYILYNMQYHIFEKYTKKNSVNILPLKDDDLPDKCKLFDTVFSMGVLYHRISPIDHLKKLKELLIKGGELVLETLVVDGDENTILLPKTRYGKMKNVWFIPSCLALEKWLKRCGFDKIELINLSVTTTKEQRKTKWMTFESLEDFLSPKNNDFTIEGLPAPTRAVFRASI